MPDPTSQDVKHWFETEVIPLRTAGAGMTFNRIVKTPAALFRGGNEADPNGLCGDTTAFVDQKMFEKFKSIGTSDGFDLGVVLWDGIITNHIANVLFPKNTSGISEYSFNEEFNQIRLESGNNAFTQAQLFKLTTLDLYEKKVASLESWWLSRSLHRAGTVKIARIWELA